MRIDKQTMRYATTLGATALVALAACEGAQRPATDFVDPFIGTGAHGHVYPGATVPFGMVQLSPDNGITGWDWVSGYHYSDSMIVGFSHTHVSGTGIGDLADVLVMPVAHAPDLTKHFAARDDRDYAARFSHDDESAEPGYYRVRLIEPGIDVELTATDRVGLHRYTYPASTDGGVVLDLGYAINSDRATDTQVRVESDTLVVGHRFSTGWARDERVYFALAFSQPFTTVRLANGETAVQSGQEASGDSVRAYFGFATEAGEIVQLKVGISYVDIAGALRNLTLEAPDWDFEGARAAARAAWDIELSSVRVTGGTDSARTVFYTALYHAKLAPILFADLDGRYRGADGEIHTADGFTNYSIYSLWDTFRAEHPLFTLLSPERVNDIVNSMLVFQQEYGYLPVWSLVGNETNTMTGHHAVPVVADAFLKGFRGFDSTAAFAAVEKSAMADHRGLRFYKHYGYIPSELEIESVTKTLEYAYDDWATAQLALGVGDTAAYQRFRARAGSYRQVFDSTTGFMRGRHADGTWVTPFDPTESAHGEHRDYTEGNAWQHSWFAPHDVRGLIDLMGGDTPFIAKLDSLFTIDTVIGGENVAPDISGLIGQYAHGNEPSHHIAYLYSYAGAPWKTQERVREILETMYDATPNGLAGNEDCGQMSAWYVLSALGFYPVNPAEGVYVLGSPVFPEATIALNGGASFTVRANNASPENKYIQSATVNGNQLTRSFIRHSEIMSGGTLELVMGPEPNREWAAGESARPASMSDAAERGR
jgi:predicted alpha-1,2-mannosidase